MNKFKLAQQQAKQMTKEQVEELEKVTQIYVDYCNKEGKKPSKKGFIKFCKEVLKELKNKENEQ